MVLISGGGLGAIVVKIVNMKRFELFLYSAERYIGQAEQGLYQF